MELKRYVMLDKKEIIDTSKEIFYFRGENQLYRDRPNAPQVTVRIGTAIKTSDNILDLVEEGDLVELSGGKERKNDIHMIINAINGNMITWDNLWIYKERDKDIISAIYKRQPNGDYKRYEVKS